MTSRGFNMDDYVGVNERIAAFKDKFPDGVLQSEIVKLTDGIVVVKGLAYRTADDVRPGIGHSSLAIPGSTPYTRGSELENAETSAWGRALAALGFEVKKGVASRNEVEAKNGHGNVVPITPGAGAASSGSTAPYRPSFATNRGTEEIPGTALKVQQITGKSGVSKSSGKPYTKYTIITEDGQAFSTFSDTIMQDAQHARDHDLGVVIEAHKTQYGSDIDSLKVVGGVLVAAGGDPTVGAPAFDPDEVPV